MPTKVNDRAYDTFEGFLKTAIRAYWDAGPNKANFLALMLACREAWEVAITRTASKDTAKRLLTGAAGAGAIAILVRVFLGGPLGLLLTGATVAALVAVYVRNHRAILDQSSKYRALIEIYKPKYEAVQSDYIGDKLRRDQRDLMMDGLVSRFLEEVDAMTGVEEETEEDKSSFSAHAKAKREDEDKEKQEER